MRLGMLIPSRGRPGNIARLWQSMQDTCTGDTELLVGLDENDPSRSEYPPGPRYFTSNVLRFVTAWVNYLAVETLDEFDCVGHFGDDNTCDTKGWDERICDSLTRQPFAFANDLYPRTPGSLSCHVFMRSDVVRVLGYAGPPEISHMYVDVAWMAWCVSCGYEYLDDVRLPHHHYTMGASHDQTYADSYAQTGVNLQAWHAYSRRSGEGGLNDDIYKLGGKPFSQDQLAVFNRDLNIPEVWGG